MLKQLCLFIWIFSLWSVAYGHSIEKLIVPGVVDGHPYELNSIFMRPDKIPGPWPLVMMTQGAPMNPALAKSFKLEMNLTEAEAISNFGYAVAIIERRGFGTSKESFAEYSGDCEHKNYEEATKATDSDLKAAFDFYALRSEIQASEIALVGHSAGGYAVLEFARTRPKGLKGVISFAGARGPDGKGSICDLKQLKKTISLAGKYTQCSELWIFSKNDHVFSPGIGQDLWEVFTTSGGRGEFWLAPPIGEEGHNLYSDGISIWKTKVKDFLASVFK